jgi:hypothetical protein
MIIVIGLEEKLRDAILLQPRRDRSQHGDVP